MLNSVTEDARPRIRLSPDDRRRQLLGIGLRMLVDKPIQDLSLDAVAQEAGISRSLLFHYFPTKNDFHDAVIGAAQRRVMRNTAPDPDSPADEAIEQFLTRFFAQVERRREFYLALVFGNGNIALGGDRVESHRLTMARRVSDALSLPESSLPVVHGWTAYVEDRALLWSGTAAKNRAPVEDEVTHCRRALDALLDV